jgi:hypothetical protein
MQDLTAFDPVPCDHTPGGKCAAGDRECKLCFLAAEHGYRVVLIDTAVGSKYVLVDLAWRGRDCAALTALEAPGGLDAIAAQLGERIDVVRAPVDPAARVDPFAGGSA